MTGYEHGDQAGERGQSMNESATNRRRRAIAIFAGVALVGGAVLGVATSRFYKDKKPEFLIEGTLPNGNTQLAGAVNLHCTENRDDAFVNATVRLVTDQLSDDKSARGCIVKTQVRFSNVSCETALEDVRTSPQPVIEGVVENVEGRGPDIFGHGRFPAAERFTEIIAEAREKNTPLFNINTPS